MLAANALGNAACPSRIAAEVSYGGNRHAQPVSHTLKAEHFLGVDVTNVRMLSVGTATAGYQPAESVEADAGAVGWLTDGRLILTLISVQQQHVQAMMEDRLGDRYMRLDAQWLPQGGLGIDVATPAAAAMLEAMGQDTLEQVQANRLAPFD
jgi:hypothetical protein